MTDSQLVTLKIGDEVEFLRVPGTGEHTTQYTLVWTKVTVVSFFLIYDKPRVTVMIDDNTNNSITCYSWQVRLVQKIDNGRANVYADWLEEHDEPMAAAKLRVSFPNPLGQVNREEQP